MKNWYILGGSVALAFLAIVISGPKVTENLRPLKNDRMQEGFGVYTDKDSGKIYGFIEGAGGEKRFVQMEKNSENKVRKERLEAEARAAKAAAKKALESLMGSVSGTLKKGGRVSLVGFGSWSVSKRAARDGRNPQTGATIKIAAKNVVKFKAGAELSSTVN